MDRVGSRMDAKHRFVFGAGNTTPMERGASDCAERLARDRNLIDRLDRVQTLLRELLREPKDRRRHELTDDAIIEIAAARSLLNPTLRPAEAADRQDRSDD